MEYEEVWAVPEDKVKLTSLGKANIIYDLISDFACSYRNYYEWNGTLHFNFKIPSTFDSLDCKITPVEDKYKIKVYAPINIETTMILYEVDEVSRGKLHDTFQGIIDYLDKEWGELSNGKKYTGWWDYKKGKEIKYDDHGYIISA